MAGHNKWSKVKRKKGVLDTKRSAIFGKLARIITLESKKSGGDRNAPSLRAAIEKARGASMPGDNIERAIQKGVGVEAAATEEVLYEAYGPGGAALLIVCVSDNRNRTGPEIKHLLSVSGGTLGAPGSALWAFTKSADGYSPSAPAALSKSDAERLAALIEAIENHDDVVEVYTNVA